MLSPFISGILSKLGAPQTARLVYQCKCDFRWILLAAMRPKLHAASRYLRF
jgi:hypothetical protein